MPTVWGLTESKDYWTAFFQANDRQQRKGPLLWICQPHLEQRTLLQERAQIYDPFIGIAVPQNVVLCLGVLNTSCYETSDGCTVELLPLERVPDPIPLAELTAAQVLPQEATAALDRCRSLRPLESNHWNCFKTVLSKTNPPLASCTVMLENWRQRRRYLENILEITARRGCTEDQEQDIFGALRALTRADTENHGGVDRLAQETRLRVAIRAQSLPVKEWEELWKELADAWYGYVLCLTPQEITCLTDLSRTFDL
jgi:hypothetical protein